MCTSVKVILILYSKLSTYIHIVTVEESCGGGDSYTTRKL